MEYNALVSIDNTSACPVKIVFDFGLMTLYIDLHSAKCFVDILLEIIPNNCKTLTSSDGPIDVRWASPSSIEIKNRSTGMQEVLSIRKAKSLGDLIAKKLLDNKSTPKSDQVDNVQKRIDDNLRGVFE